MNLGVTHISSMDVDKYIHNYEGFYKKSINEMFINKRRMTKSQKCPCKPCENSLLYSLSLLVKSFEEEIQPYGYRVDTVRG